MIIRGKKRWQKQELKDLDLKKLEDKFYFYFLFDFFIIFL